MTRTEFQSACTSLGLTRADVASIFGYGWGQVNEWWNGRYRVPEPVSLLMTIWLHPAFPDQLRPRKGIRYELPVDDNYYRRKPERRAYP